MINTQFMMLVIAIIAFMSVAAMQFAQTDANRIALLSNISKAITDHNENVIKAIPKTNYTAQAEAIATIQDLKQEITEIKYLLMNSTQ